MSTVDLDLDFSATFQIDTAKLNRRDQLVKVWGTIQPTSAAATVHDFALIDWHASNLASRRATEGESLVLIQHDLSSSVLSDAGVDSMLATPSSAAINWLREVKAIIGAYALTSPGSLGSRCVASSASRWFEALGRLETSAGPRAVRGAKVAVEHLVRHGFSIRDVTQLEDDGIVIWIEGGGGSYARIECFSSGTCTLSPPLGSNVRWLWEINDWNQDAPGAFADLRSVLEAR